MIFEQILTNLPADVAADIVTPLGKIALWLQTIGLLIVAWFVFQTVAIINNRIRRRKLTKIEQKLETIERKLDTLISKKKTKKK